MTAAATVRMSATAVQTRSGVCEGEAGSKKQLWRNKKSLHQAAEVRSLLLYISRELRQQQQPKVRTHLQRLLFEEPAVCKHVLHGTLVVQHIQRSRLTLFLKLATHNTQQECSRDQT
jgi:hypothetical protein